MLSRPNFNILRLFAREIDICPASYSNKREVLLRTSTQIPFSNSAHDTPYSLQTLSTPCTPQFGSTVDRGHLRDLSVRVRNPRQKTENGSYRSRDIQDINILDINDVAILHFKIHWRLIR